MIEKKYGIVVILGMCMIILLIGMIKKKAELVLNFFVRMVFGMICVYFLNGYFAAQGIPVSVGLNPFNAVTLGSLGAGGFALLYGISFCQFF